MKEKIWTNDKQYNVDQWRTFTISLPKEVVVFREKIFDDLLEAYGKIWMMGEIFDYEK